MRGEFTERLVAAMGSYLALFPGTMPDMRSISRADYYRLPEVLDRARVRGSPVTDADFSGVVAPNPETGRVL